MARNKAILSDTSATSCRLIVQEFLKQTKLTREFLSEAAGLTKSYLRVFLLGHCGITIQTWLRLCMAMKRLSKHRRRK